MFDGRKWRETGKEAKLLMRSGIPAPRSFWELRASLLPSTPTHQHPFFFNICAMSLLAVNTVDRLDRPSAYFGGKNKRRRYNDEEEQQEQEKADNKLKNATTLYVGNLCGEIKRLVMGLDRFNKTPCGFCFVEYYTHQDALDCLKYVGGTKLDERIIRTDLDPGFEEGRQFGRGKSGGQVRDEYREEYDPGRGGYGRAYDEQRQREEDEYGAGR
ncbi:unnamed protein product [Penicillium salamii]|nr:unnamed protein product [Penicillium salamii]CAG8299982.1 unnamed protein product [Penicillium salamii]